MGSRESGRWSLVVGLVVLAVFAVGLVGGVWWALTRLPATVAAPTVIGSATVIVSVVTVLITNQRNRAREIENDHRRQKIPVYEGFLEFLFSVLLADNTGRKRPSDKQMIQVFSDFTRDITLWGGPELIRTWNEVRSVGDGEGLSGIELVRTWERLLFAIREDIGHSNKGLAKDDLLRLFVNDLDEQLTTE